MKYTVVIFFTALFLCSLSYKSDKDYYPTGELRSETTFDSACNCKRYTEYYKSGQKKLTATYLVSNQINTKIDGAETQYFENGNIALYTFWKNAAPNKLQYANFPNGQLAYEHYYLGGFKDGTWRYYNEDRTLRQEQYFEPGKTKYGSDFDYLTNKFYLANKLAYTEKIVNGKQVDVKVIDKLAYNKLQSSLLHTGKQLFMANCAVCHNINADIVGPKLKGITQQRTKEWLEKMIANGNSLVSQNDSIAVAVYARWQNTQHPGFETLDSKEIDDIIQYLSKFN